MTSQLRTSSKSHSTSTPCIVSKNNNFVHRECPCGGLAGLTSQCDECARNKMSGLREAQAEKAEKRIRSFISTSPSRQPEQPVSLPRPGSFAGHSFDNIAIGTTRNKNEAAFGVCDNDDVKCQGGSGTGAIDGGTTTPALAGTDAGAATPAAPAPIVHTNPSITWGAETYSAVNTGGSSTTIETDFGVNYKALDDTPNNVWRLDAQSISGGVTITVHTGGSTDPIANPPTTEADAKEAVTVMKGYYASGGRGKWHTEAASKAHELHHYSEWKCSSDHYWPTALTALNGLTAPRAANANEAAAVTTMKAGAGGADAIMGKFKKAARDYWMTLADNASSRPYAAGQLVLNNAITSVQGLAAGKGWVVEQGTDTPSAADPCYAPKPAFVI